MGELEEIKNELTELRESVINLSCLYRKLPDTIIQIYYEGLLNEIRYLYDFVDCMIAFNITPSHETND